MGDGPTESGIFLNEKTVKYPAQRKFLAKKDTPK